MTLRQRLPFWLVRAWSRVRPWWHCRHCGAEVYSYRCACPPAVLERIRVAKNKSEPRDVHERRHVAHRHGEGHCDAPCPRWRRCHCWFVCSGCDALVGGSLDDHECVA